MLVAVHKGFFGGARSLVTSNLNIVIDGLMIPIREFDGRGGWRTSLRRYLVPAHIRALELVGTCTIEPTLPHTRDNNNIS